MSSERVMMNDTSIHQLNERVKELQCLYSVAEVIQKEELTLAEAIRQIVTRIPPAWQFPEIACARIILGETIFESRNFRETSWRQVAQIYAKKDLRGTVEVFYTEPSPSADEGPFLKEERSLINTIARMIGQLIVRKQSEDDLRSLAAKLSLAEQEERFRIATDVHDSVSQPLGLLSILFGALQQKLGPDGKYEEMGKIRELLDHVIQAVRQLSFDLAPPVLYDLGLEAAIEVLTERVAQQHPIQIDFIRDREKLRLSTPLRVLLYMMTRELLLNVVKHAGASRCTVTVGKPDHAIQITVEDNGAGFDLNTAEKEQHEGHHFGLFSVRERIRHFGGSLAIESRKGRGTRVVLVAPLEAQ